MPCPSNKTEYMSPASAEKALKSIRKRSRRFHSKGSKVTNRSYRCHTCGHWHLTSMEMKDRRQWKRQRRQRPPR